MSAKQKERPFVPSVTNYVTAGFVADCQLAAGCSAAMVTLPDEACEAAAKCSAFYVNLGTILPVYEKTVPNAAEKLWVLGKPWVLDPVAAGLGETRTKLLLELKKYKPAIIRGNASEIINLARIWKLQEGSLSGGTVDSSAKTEDAAESAVLLAEYTGGAVAVSGSADYVTDGKYAVVSYGGSPLMERGTGYGCALGGIAACCLVLAEPVTAALCAVNAFNHAGRCAEKKCSGTGSFRQAFMDELYNMTAEKIAHNSFEIAECR